MLRALVLLAVLLPARYVRAQKPTCDLQFLGRVPTLKGDWEIHEDPMYMGMYEPGAACPAWGKDWDCQLDGDFNLHQVKSVYSKVFRPHDCNLRTWNAEHFADCTAMRRIIMVGDSLMRQQWMSLACLLSEVSVSGEHHLWDQDKVPVAMSKNYTARGITTDFVIPRQYIGRFDLKSGTQVFLRAFGRFNLTLWDDVFKEFEPLTDQDVIIVNFGAWYPRYNVHESGDPWKAWQDDMSELITQRLSRYPTRTFWRSSTATHFGGINGTMTFEQDQGKALAASGRCPPSPFNENWYEDWVKTFLRSCGPKCANVHLLPVFDLTATRHDAHHGNFGRGRDSWVLDCRHFCTGVVDVWNQVMYNLLC